MKTITTKKAKQILKKSGSKDNSHIARIKNGGWRPGSDCFYIQQHLTMDSTKLAKAIMKKQKDNPKKCFATLEASVRRVNQIKRQAKNLGIRKAR